MKSIPYYKIIVASYSRLIALFLFAISSAMYSANLSALANSIIYTAPSDNQNANFTGDFPIKQIGPIALPKASVQFQGTDVNILAVPDWLFDRSAVLTGVLVNVQVELLGKTNILKGLVYFLEGSWLANLGSTNALDVVDTISGEQLRGHFRARLNDGLAFKPESGAMRKLLFNEIKNIRSPRAYTFSIVSELGKLTPLSNSMQFDAHNISFSPTFGSLLASKTSKVPESHFAGTEPGISKKEITALVGMNMTVDLLPAVVIPLVLNKSNETAALNQILRYNLQHQ